jgi:hypothetical protein
MFEKQDRVRITSSSLGGPMPIEVGVIDRTMLHPIYGRLFRVCFGDNFTGWWYRETDIRTAEKYDNEREVT